MREERRKTNLFKRRDDFTATPGSELKKSYDKCIKDSDLDLGIKVVEKAGRMLRNIVQKSDPFKKKKCEDGSNCMVCSEDESRGRCRPVLGNTLLELLSSLLILYSRELLLYSIFYPEYSRVSKNSR